MQALVLSSEFFVQVYYLIASLLLDHCYIGPLAMVSNLHRLYLCVCPPPCSALISVKIDNKTTLNGI